MSALFVALLGPVAAAQPTDAVEPVAVERAADVHAGGDLEAWRSLQELRPEGREAVDAYFAFIAAWPESPLAEVAWGRLHDLDAADRDRADPALRPVLDDLERSWRAHRQALERTPTQVFVAPLDPDGASRQTLPARWTPSFHGGVGWDGSDVYGVVGLRAERGPVSVIGRLGNGQRPYAGVSGRLSATPWGPFGELGVDTLGRVELLGGGRIDLEARLWLEASAGFLWVDARPVPTVRLEMVHLLRGLALR